MLKVVFAGTADFACPSLARILEMADCQVLAVYTKQDKKKGRGLQVRPSPVKELALKHDGIKVVQPATLRDEKEQAHLRAFGADVLVNVACGFILPPSVLSMFPHGCVNVHPSLLPRWRGAAPIQRAVMAGDQETGVTIMRMDEGLDTGDIYLQEKVAIGENESCAALYQRLAELGGQLLQRVLRSIANGQASCYQQAEVGVTYAHKLEKDERPIDWQDDARAIACKIRAFALDMPACTSLNGKRWLIHEARAGRPAELGSTTNSMRFTAGQILEVRPNGVAVASGDGEVVWLTKLQAEGGKMLTARDFYNAYRASWPLGAVLDGQADTLVCQV